MSTTTKHDPDLRMQYPGNAHVCASRGCEPARRASASVCSSICGSWWVMRMRGPLLVNAPPWYHFNTVCLLSQCLYLCVCVCLWGRERAREQLCQGAVEGLRGPPTKAPAGGLSCWADPEKRGLAWVGWGTGLDWEGERERWWQEMTRWGGGGLRHDLN